MGVWVPTAGLVQQASKQLEGSECVTPHASLKEGPRIPGIHVSVIPAARVSVGTQVSEK